MHRRLTVKFYLENDSKQQVSHDAVTIVFFGEKYLIVKRFLKPSCETICRDISESIRFSLKPSGTISTKLQTNRPFGLQAWDF